MAHRFAPSLVLCLEFAVFVQRAIQNLSFPYVVFTWYQLLIIRNCLAVYPNCKIFHWYWLYSSIKLLSSLNTRGRLAVLHTIMGKAMGAICCEMKERHSPFHVGDVKYHLGLVRSFLSFKFPLSRNYKRPAFFLKWMNKIKTKKELLYDELQSPKVYMFANQAATYLPVAPLQCSRTSKAFLHTTAATGSVSTWQIFLLIDYMKSNQSTSTSVLTQGNLICVRVFKREFMLHIDYDVILDDIYSTSIVKVSIYYNCTWLTIWYTSYFWSHLEAVNPVVLGITHAKQVCLCNDIK